LELNFKNEIFIIELKLAYRNTFSQFFLTRDENVQISKFNHFSLCWIDKALIKSIKNIHGWNHVKVYQKNSPCK